MLNICPERQTKQKPDLKHSLQCTQTQQQQPHFIVPPNTAVSHPRTHSLPIRSAGLCSPNPQSNGGGRLTDRPPGHRRRAFVLVNPTWSIPGNNLFINPTNLRLLLPYMTGLYIGVHEQQRLLAMPTPTKLDDLLFVPPKFQDWLRKVLK